MWITLFCGRLHHLCTEYFCHLIDCCQCLHQEMLSLWCSVTRTPSPSLNHRTNSSDSNFFCAAFTFKDIVSTLWFCACAWITWAIFRKNWACLVCCVYTTRATGHSGSLSSCPSTATPRVNSIEWQTSSREERVLRAPDEGRNVSMHRSFQKH